MKRHWQNYAARIDGLTLRERTLVFATACAVILFVAYFLSLGPALRKQSQLAEQISQQQNNLAGMNGEIAQKVQEYQRDPDAAARERLVAVQAESARLSDSLRTMQKGLVAPERMAPLIDTILRANGHLQLVSMRTLPVTSLNAPERDATPQTKPDAKGEAGANPATPSMGVTPKEGSLLYSHGVEVSVRGNYLDMIDYMTALESLPTQLFWGSARLEVEDYPSSRLTLTLYTLSLDPKWLKL